MIRKNQMFVFIEPIYRVFSYLSGYVSKSLNFLIGKFRPVLIISFNFFL